MLAVVVGATSSAAPGPDRLSHMAIGARRLPPLILRHLVPFPPSAPRVASFSQMSRHFPDSPPPDYSSWSTGDLISRVHHLERTLSETTSLLSGPSRLQKPKKSFDPTRYSTRLIALKFAYLGGQYGGYEIQKTAPLPTIEQRLFEALLKARLVPANPDCPDSESVDAWPGDEVTQYSKCGRTDRGVSAFGQVVGVRVRSNRPLPRIPPEEEPPEGESVKEVEFDESKELPYPEILNRLLPPQIRILSWCPNPPPAFSARFDCQMRHYRYFFSNPAIPATPKSTGELDIPAMRDAAARFLGTHDFRNFCKIDASKQIENFSRHIYRAEIEELETPPPHVFNPIGSTLGPGQGPKWYSFTLHGSAFLWHQVRHMMAILFYVGQGLEKPSIVSEMLDMSIYPTKPNYDMADDRPLILWDCVFPEDQLKWLPAESVRRGPTQRDGLVDSVWSEWKRTKMEELQWGMLLDKVAEQSPKAHNDDRRQSQIIVSGGVDVKPKGQYKPIRTRERMRDVDEINRAWVEKNGEIKMNNAKGRAKRKAAEVEGNGRVVDG